MRFRITTAMLAMASVVHAAVTPPGYSPARNLCEGKSVEEKGNTYCQKVQRISYENMGVGKGGSYNEVVDMDPETGKCKFMPVTLSGPLVPFTDPLSLHFRGPLNLKQVAVYMPKRPGDKASQTQSKPAKATRGIKARTANLGHGQHSAPHLEHYYNAFAKAFNNGTRWTPPINDHRNHTGSRHSSVSVSVPTGSSSRLQNWKLPPTPTPSPDATARIETDTVTFIATATVEVSQAFYSVPTTTNTGAADSVTVTREYWNTHSVDDHGCFQHELPYKHHVKRFSNPGGSRKSPQFVRTGYYNAEQQKAEGVMFLGNYGGQGSGKWTPTFGNTLSYVNADGTGGAANATTLKDTTLQSSQEVALFTDKPCDSSCGYVQNGSGFNGPSKIFLLEFSMPHTTTPPVSGNTTSPGYDQPAIWLLNARIPYTAQYHTCSCWSTGCGELDIFEVLSPGHDKAKTTVRSTYQGGDPNWFERPVDVNKPVRLAVVFDGEKGGVEIMVLGRGEGEFPEVVGGREGVEGLGVVRRGVVVGVCFGLGGE
ncbi:putative TOS1-like glycosyl hydrolase-domain-containing protein [Chaetomium sp. MPI-CAGE-AT-0009]|nr:putative TOS1-like glycosyl hydrolase-domain-containing protein [Chaetomium sp. MPI-CAGE-AT-0009]